MPIEAKGATDLPHNVLTLLEKQSSTWLKIEKHLNKALETLRRKNDIEPLDSTERLRGRIQAYKYVLSLGSRTSIPVDSDSADIME